MESITPRSRSNCFSFIRHALQTKQRRFKAMIADKISPMTLGSFQFGLYAWVNCGASWAIIAHQHSHLHVVQHFLTSAYAKCFFGFVKVHHCEQLPQRIALTGASSGRACHATPAYCGGSSEFGALLIGRPMVLPQLQRKVLTMAIIHHSNKPHNGHFGGVGCTYLLILPISERLQGRHEQILLLVSERV